MLRIVRDENRVTIYAGDAILWEGSLSEWSAALTRRERAGDPKAA